MAAAPAPEVFVRKSSGLHRDWSQRHAFFYNFLAAASLGGGFVLTASQVGPAFWRGGDPITALVLATLGTTPIILSFALLGASMPRAGGDYVWMSRIIHPAVGFALTQLNLTLFGAGWFVVNGFSLAWAYVNPALYLLGFKDAAAWAASPTGQGIIAFVFGLIAAGIIALGMKHVARWITVTTITTILGTLAYLAVGFAYTSSSYASTYDKIFGAGTYQSIISTAQANGYSAAPFNWTTTLIYMTFLTGQLALCMFANPHLGEVKNARDLKLTLSAFLGALLLSSILAILTFAMINNLFGNEFWGALNYLFLIGKGANVLPQFTPYFPFMASLALGSGSGQTLMVIVLLVGLVLQAGIYYQILNQFNGVKYLFSAAFDRILPEKIAHVDRRTGAPIVALGIILAMALVWVVAALLNPVFLIYRSVTAFGIADLVYFGGVCVAAIVFPYKLRDVYNASPVAKYRIAGAPVISIAGVVGLLYILTLLGLYGSQAVIWNLSLPAVALVTVLYLAVAAIYFISWAVRRSQGIPLSIAFKELPPE